MEFKFMVLVALMGLILLSCRSYAQENTNKASTMAERPSFGGHNEAVNRKLLLRGPVLPEEKIGGSSSSAETKGTHDNQHGLTPSAETTSRLVERDLSSKKAGIGNNHQLKGKQASSTRIMSAEKMINSALAEDQTVWQITEKQGIRTSVKSYSSRQKRALLLEASMQQQISHSTGAFNTVVEDSNNNKHVSASPAPPEVSQPFSASHETQSREDDGREITRMDYTPAQRRPPIHNKSAP